MNMQIEGNPSVDSLRLPMLNAMAWRIVAELYRRYAVWHMLTLQEAHPRLSLPGQLRLLLAPIGPRPYVVPTLLLNLGGPAGTYSLEGVPGVSGESRDFVNAMLAGDPRVLVNGISRELRLAVPQSLPRSTPSVLAVRTIAEVFARAVFSPGSLRATCACVDTDLGSYVCAWAAAVGVDVRKHDAASRAQRQDPHLVAGHLFAIHEAMYGDGPLEVAEGDFVVFDLARGVMHLMHGRQRSASRNLATLYVENARRLAGAADLALKHLGR
jgi:hypothetical protein